MLEEKKGLPHKFLAFNKFLQANPKWREDCVFLQICIQDHSFVYGDPKMDISDPTRVDLVSQIHQMSGEICSTYGSFGSVPVHFLDRAYSTEELIPILAIADVCLCTPLRDNLSFTAVEYIICQKHNVSLRCRILP